LGIINNKKENIMSVILKSEKEISKIYNTLSKNKQVQEFASELDFFKKRNKYAAESKENFIARAVWYGYIANVTAYNVQYQDNQQINFNIECEDVFESLSDAIDALGSLLYNVATNDGNIFLMDDWYNVLSKINNKFVVEEEVEIPNWCY
jgi:ACT domain-containing protein